MPSTTTSTAAALPLIWNRPRLRFIEGAPDGAAPATGTPTPPPAAPAAPASDPDPDGAEHLGDPGKQALIRMKEERNALRDALRAYESLGLAPDAIKELVGRDQSANEQAVREQAKREAAEEAQARLATKLRQTEVRAQASLMKFHNAADALRYVGDKELAAIDVSDTDDVDAEAVKALLTEVVKQHPYLVGSAIADHRAAGIGSAPATGAAPTTPGMGTLRAAYGASSKQ